MSDNRIEIKIPDHVRRAHERLSATGLKYFEYAGRHPETLKRANYRSLEWGDMGYQFQPWPTFINQHARQEFEQAGEEVFRLVTSIPGRFFSYDPSRIADYYRIGPDLAEYFLLGVDDEHLRSVVGRGDYIYSAEGLKCLEFNINSNLGGLELTLWESICLRVPLIARFFEEYQIEPVHPNLLVRLLEHLVEVSLKRFAAEKEINVLFLTNELEWAEKFYRNISLEQTYKDILQQLAPGLEGGAFACHLSQLNEVDKSVYHRGRRVHTIYEYLGGEVPLRLAHIFSRGQVLIFDGPVSFLASNKLNLALLSEHEDSGDLSPQERETVRKYIPWTRKLTDRVTTYAGEKIDLRDFVLVHQERLVMKPSLGLGGGDIYIGRHTAKEQWRALLDRAMGEKNWLVQEYVESLPYLYQAGEYGTAQHQAVWGIFVFGGRYAGLFSRLLPVQDSKGIINSAQGAQRGIVFEVRD
jgi:hypothetical protein